LNKFEKSAKFQQLDYMLKRLNGNTNDILVVIVVVVVVVVVLN